MGKPNYTIEDVDKKWMPLTKGMDKREAVYTAHALEAEARYLQAEREKPLAGAHTPGLKYIFPIIRKAVPNLLDGDLTNDRARNVFRTAADAVFGVDAASSHMEYDKPTFKEIAAFVDPVAVRAKTSIECLRDIL